MKKLPKKTLCVLFILVSLVGKVGKTRAQEVYFLQKEGNQPIVELYNGASNTICIAAYVITSSDIALALVDASRRGIKVKLLLDEKQTWGNKFSQHFLLMKGKNVEIKFMDEKLGRFASDFGIIDGSIVCSGGSLLHTDIKSNPKVGDYLIIRDNEQIIAKYQSEFDTLFSRAKSIRMKK